MGGYGGRSHASNVIVEATFAHPWATAECKVNVPPRGGSLAASVCYRKVKASCDNNVIARMVTQAVVSMAASRRNVIVVPRYLAIKKSCAFAKKKRRSGGDTPPNPPKKRRKRKSPHQSRPPRMIDAESLKTIGDHINQHVTLTTGQIVDVIRSPV